MREVAELLADPPVEVGALELGEPPSSVAEPHLYLLAAGQLLHRLAVQRDVHRVSLAGVADVQHVVGSDDERGR